MHQAIEKMLSPYKCNSPEEYKNALKEIAQEITLLGLSRQGFFDKAAFYGGSTLRIAHKLNRFSEDLDFTLLTNDLSFSLNKYLKGIEEELSAYGFNFTAKKIDKSIKTSVESAFLKGNTLIHLLTIEGLKNPGSGFNKNDLIKIKIEIDTEPPSPNGKTEVLFHSRPIPFTYKSLTLPSLFAGKLHAVLCRKYKSGRIKGRDFYDFVWYVSNGIEPDLSYLKAKLVQSGAIDNRENFSMPYLKKILSAKFKTINWEEAKKDVLPFISDPFELKVWSIEFFENLLSKM